MFDPTPRERGVIVQVVDLTDLLAQAKASLIKQGKATDADKVSTAFTQAIATDQAGNHYLLCSEGVGWEAQDIDGVPTFTLDLYVESAGYIAIMASATLRIAADDLLDEPTTEVDLADFVRVFGGRLEDNFWIWHRTLTRKGGK